MNNSKFIIHNSTKHYSDYKKLEEENERLSKNQRYYKNGVFCLEYDKETMSDMIDDYKSRIDKAIEYIENMPYAEVPDEDYENNHKMVEWNDSELLKILKGEE